ncbi:phage major capsid protein [bacterium]|nr:phage major capsid protein [bacterium]
MSEKIIEKLDAIEAANLAKVEEVTSSVDAKLAETVASFDEKVAALEAKVASIQAPSIVKTYKSISQEVNRMVKGQLAEFVKNNGRIEKELKMFEDANQYDAFLKEASALTGSGAGIGGRTAYDPVFFPLRLANPLRGVSRTVATDGATYQFRAKVGNAGVGWGYTVTNNTAATTEDTNIWQLTLQDLNVQFPIRTAALDDIDGLESNVVADMLLEFSQNEALSMIQNNDQAAQSASNPYGGTNGLRGLDQYAGANATYAGGTISTAAFGSTGTGSSSGLHTLATYDQLTTNANTVGAANIKYKDVVNFIYSLPQQYWTESAKFVINPVLLQQIRGLVDDQGRPIYIDGLSRTDGIVGTLLGFDVVVNKYLDNPSQATTGSAGTSSLYPMYFGDWQRGHTIVDRLNMVLRRYDQTLPGSITFYGEKRLATSVVDPFAIIRYRSTGTAT